MRYFWIVLPRVRWMCGRQAPPLSVTMSWKCFPLLPSSECCTRTGGCPAGMACPGSFSPSLAPNLAYSALRAAGVGGGVQAHSFSLRGSESCRVLQPHPRSPQVPVTRAFSLSLDLGLSALKMPKDADNGGRATSGSARKGRRPHSSPQNPLLDCSLCGKVFSSASSLSKHYLTHSQERKHVCKICSKAFKRQDHLYVGVWADPAGGRGGAAMVPCPFVPSQISPLWGFPLPCPPPSVTSASSRLHSHTAVQRSLVQPQIHTRGESAAGLEACDGSLQGRFHPGGNWAHSREIFGVPGRCLRRTDLSFIRNMY